MKYTKSSSAKSALSDRGNGRVGCGRTRYVAPRAFQHRTGRLANTLNSPFRLSLDNRRSTVRQAPPTQYRVTTSFFVLCWCVNSNISPLPRSLICLLQVDLSVADPTSIQGRALRVVTHTVHALADYTPFVGGQIRRLMCEIVSRRHRPRFLMASPSFSVVAITVTTGAMTKLPALNGPILTVNYFTNCHGIMST
jgi:hypothetical protein